MKHRVKKRRLLRRLPLPKAFVRATRRGLAEARAGQVTPYLGLGRRKVRPVPLDLSGADGTRRVLEAAKKVMVEHAAVLDALAKR